MYTLHQYSYIRARQRGRYFKLRETHLYTPPVQLYQGKVEGRYFKLRETHLYTPPVQLYQGKAKGEIL